MTEVQIYFNDMGLDNDSELALILTGQEPDRDGIRLAFISGIVEHLFHEFYQSYLTRSFGLNDNLGNSWLPNAEKTTRRKHSNLIMRHHDQILEALKPSPSQSNSYHPGPHQHVLVSNSVLILGIDISYAQYAEAAGPGREIIPHNWYKWLKSAVEHGLHRVQHLLDS